MFDQTGNGKGPHFFCGTGQQVAGAGDDADAFIRPGAGGFIIVVEIDIAHGDIHIDLCRRIFHLHRDRAVEFGDGGTALHRTDGKEGVIIG